MPRDVSGNYTLPVGNPVVDGTTIESTWANGTMSDIALQLNNVLTRDGLLGPTGPFKMVSGNAAAPGYSFAAQTNMGMYRQGADKLSFSVAGSRVAEFSTTGIDINNGLTVNGASKFLNAANTFGSSTAYDGEGAFSYRIQAHGTGVAGSGLGLYNWANGVTSDARLSFNKSKSNVIGTHTAVSSGDDLGSIAFGGSDGTNFQTGALIKVEAAENFTPTNSGARLLLQTTNTTGSTTPVTRVDIDFQRVAFSPRVEAPSARLNGATGVGTLTVQGSAASGATVSASADDIVIDAELAGGYSVLTQAGGTGWFLFGDPGNGAAGGFSYLHSTDTLNIRTNDVVRMSVSNSNVDLKAGVDLTGPTAHFGTANTDGIVGIADGSAGAVTPATLADDLVIEGSGNQGISILTQATGIGTLAFGSPTGNAQGRIRYDHNTEELSLWSAGVTRVTLTSAFTFNNGVDAVLNTNTAPTSETSVGFRAQPQNAQPASYVLVASDSGKHLFHANGSGAGHTWTIPANASVAFPVGTRVRFINFDSNTVSIAITSDTLRRAGTGATGTRTLAQWGDAEAIKVTATSWLIDGSGLT